MKEIPLTKGYVAIVDDEDYEMLMQYRWFYERGYAARSNKLYDNYLMHRLILGLNDRSVYCDHINMDKLDNRRCNLRVCNKSQNGSNRTADKSSKTGYRGVYHIKGRYVVELKKNGILYRVGSYINLKDAVIAYNKKAQEIHGDYARLNVWRHESLIGSPGSPGHGQLHLH